MGDDKQPLGSPYSINEPQMPPADLPPPDPVERESKHKEHEEAVEHKRTTHAPPSKRKW